MSDLGCNDWVVHSPLGLPSLSPHSLFIGLVCGGAVGVPWWWWRGRDVTLSERDSMLEEEGLSTMVHVTLFLMSSVRYLH